MEEIIKHICKKILYWSTNLYQLKFILQEENYIFNSLCDSGEFKGINIVKYA